MPFFCYITDKRKTLNKKKNNETISSIKNNPHFNDENSETK